MKRIGDIQLESYDDLFTESGTVDEVRMIQVKDLYPFPGHPFKVVDDDSMNELVQSIQDRGVINPIIVRPRVQGGYEIISGHRRTFACKKIGLTEIPACIRDLTDDDAIDQMVYSNYQRKNILPSEKAKAYRMQSEAASHQGKAGKRTDQIISEKYGDSARQVQRYIRLSYLIPGLLQLVDAKKLKLNAGVMLSYIGSSDQEAIQKIYTDYKKLPSLNNACEIKELAGKGEEPIGEEKLLSIIVENMNSKRPEGKAPLNITIEELSRYFAPGTTNDEIRGVIISLLEKYHNNPQ